MRRKVHGSRRARPPRRRAALVAALVLGAIGLGLAVPLAGLGSGAAGQADLSRIITPGENLPDPFVLPVDNGYELYASQTGIYGAEIQVAFSKTLGGWHDFRAALSRTPVWADDGFSWAPDVRDIRGRFVMYFDALAKKSLFFHLHTRKKGLSERAQCIGIATANAPGGPFVPEPRPLICDFRQHGAIDPRTFVGPDGKLWLDWKSDNNAATPARFEPTHLFAQPLAPDGLELAGPPSLLMKALSPWEERIVEAPQMVESKGAYFLFFSGAWFNNPSYGIGVARCAGPAGPCRDLSTKGPWLGSNPQGAGPGEESLCPGPDGSWWMVYAPWFDGYKLRDYRPVDVALVGFRAGGPFLEPLPSVLP